MVKEHGQYMADLMASLPQGDPYRSFLRTAIKANRAEKKRLEAGENARRTMEALNAHPVVAPESKANLGADVKLERARAIGRLVRNSFLGQMGDEVAVSDVLPRPLSDYSSRVQDAEADERWAPIVAQLGKGDLQRLSHAIGILEYHINGGQYRYHHPFSRLDEVKLRTVGDLRDITEAQIMSTRCPNPKYTRNFGPNAAAILHAAFGRPPQPASELSLVQNSN